MQHPDGQAIRNNLLNYDVTIQNTLPQVALRVDEVGQQYISHSDVELIALLACGCCLLFPPASIILLFLLFRCSKITTTFLDTNNLLVVQKKSIFFERVTSEEQISYNQIYDFETKTSVVTDSHGTHHFGLLSVRLKNDEMIDLSYRMEQREATAYMLLLKRSLAERVNG
jgi:hypothetical protein